jgi:hypothetical protein
MVILQGGGQAVGDGLLACTRSGEQASPLLIPVPFGVWPKGWLPGLVTLCDACMSVTALASDLPITLLADRGPCHT